MKIIIRMEYHPTPEAYADHGWCPWVCSIPAIGLCEVGTTSEEAYDSLMESLKVHVAHENKQELAKTQEELLKEQEVSAYYDEMGKRNRIAISHWKGDSEQWRTNE